MRRIRLHVTEALRSGTTVTLSGPPAHHLLKVLRRRVGDSVVLFNGDGQEHEAEILDIQGKSQCQVSVTSSYQPATESPLRVHLVQAIGRGDRMDWAVQKSVELGVHRIQPLITERVEVRLSGERAEKRRAHWQQVAISACEQSGRVRIPEIHPILSISELQPREGALLFLDPEAELPLVDMQGPEQGLSLAIGPEGGFSGQELAHLKRLGFNGYRLGPRVLRTETAGPAALAILQSRFGDC